MNNNKGNNTVASTILLLLLLLLIKLLYYYYISIYSFLPVKVVKRSSMSIDVLVHAEPDPTPAPNPANTRRALEEPPPLAKTIPAIPPKTKPIAPCAIIFSKPSWIVSGIT